MMEQRKKTLQKERVDVAPTPDCFWEWLSQLISKVEFGRVELTIVAGCIDSVHVQETYKPKLTVDTDGNNTIEWKENPTRYRGTAG